MIEHIYVYFLERPSRMTALGKAVFTIASVLLLAGLLGHAATSVIGVLKQLGEGHGTTSLAEVVPNIPTWWIPENIASGLICVLFLLAGMLIAHSGRTLERQLRHL